MGTVCSEHVGERPAPHLVAGGAERVDSPDALGEVASTVLVLHRRLLAGGIPGRYEDVVETARRRIHRGGGVDAGVGALRPSGRCAPVGQVDRIDATVSS